jgi:hypothetical protein
MALVVNLIGTAGGVWTAEEMVEAHFVQTGAGCVRRQVSADTGELHVRPLHHGHRVPADDATNALLEQRVTGILALVVGRQRVDVVGVERKIWNDAVTLRGVEHTTNQITRTASTGVLDHGVDRIEPFARFSGIEIDLLVLKIRRHG